MQGFPGRSSQKRLTDGECRETEASGREKGQLEGQAVLFLGQVPRGRLVLGTAGTRGGEAGEGWLCEAQSRQNWNVDGLPWGSEQDLRWRKKGRERWKKEEKERKKGEGSV